MQRKLTFQMTGLDVDKDEIIEIFCIITNGNLETLDGKGWGAVIQQPKARMDQMVRILCFPTLAGGETDVEITG